MKIARFLVRLTTLSIFLASTALFALATTAKAASRTHEAPKGTVKSFTFTQSRPFPGTRRGGACSSRPSMIPPSRHASMFGKMAITRRRKGCWRR